MTMTIVPWNGRRTRSPSIEDEFIDISSDSESESDTASDDGLGSESQFKRRTITKAAKDDLEVVDDAEDDQSVTSEGTESEEDLGPGTESFQQSSRTKIERRLAFQATSARMETPADIKLRYPEGLHPGTTYDESICREKKVFQEFSAVSESLEIEDDTFEQLTIADFSIYNSILPKKRGKKRGYHPNGQFEDLHVVLLQKDKKTFLLDGTVIQDGESRKLMGSMLAEVSIGGLMNYRIHTTADSIWIQTIKSKNYSDCWYHLTQPSEGYRQTWDDFIWLADFTKHVIDVLNHATEQSRQIDLKYFEGDFLRQLQDWHRGDPSFERWCARCDSSNYRAHLALNGNFFRDRVDGLSKECDCLHILDHPVWDDIAAGEYMHGQEKSSEAEQTVVTPLVGAAFSKSFPGWSRRGHDLLKIVQMAPEVAAKRDRRRIQLGFPNKMATNTPPGNVASLLEKAAAMDPPRSFSAAYLLGKIVVVRQRELSSDNGRPTSEPQFQFAWVRESVRSGRALRVVWLAVPSDTICGSDYERTSYPVSNELFFTDQCNRKPILATDVVAACDGDVLGHRTHSAEVVVQMLYSFEDETFETPCQAKLLCRRDDCQHRNSSPSVTAETIERTLERSPILRNMSLFSGCGLLDHGLAEAGCLETVYAIDHNEAAIRSHALNNKYKQCRYVIGSVNIALAKFLRGRVTMPEIDSIDAGSPCTGYSSINAHKGKIKSQRNSSLVMSAASWIDLFLPEVVVLENVRGMYATPKDTRLGNAGAQTICCLVALGYQVRKLQLFACDYGGPTIRERHFLIATAPGIKLPASPPITHGNGDDLLPFRTARDAFEGLEPVHNDVRINIGDPLHIPMVRLLSQIVWPVNLRNIVQRIPHTRQSSLLRAYQGGYLSREQEEWFMAQSNEKLKGSSQSLRRIDPDSPCRAALTKISPLDSRSGMVIHPFEHRVISLKEMCRIQGMPVSFLLVGSLVEQIKLVGNGVVWQVAAAIGESIGQALKASSWRRKTVDALNADRLSEAGLTTSLKTHESQEIIDLTDELENVSVSARSDVRPFQTELKEIAKRAKSLDRADLPDGDTIEVQIPSEDVWAPLSDQASDVEAEKPIILQQSTDGLEMKIESMDSQALVSSQSTDQSEREVYEISEDESMVMEPNGTFNYQYRRRGKVSRNSSSAAKPKRKLSTIDLILRTRRADSGIPPPPYSDAATKIDHDEDSDGDIVFLESRPVFKKTRID